MLRDEYETRTVFVAASGEPGAGEGLFAGRDLRAGELAALFNGLRIRKEGRGAANVKPDSDEWSDYRVTLGKIWILFNVS